MNQSDYDDHDEEEEDDYEDDDDEDDDERQQYSNNTRDKFMDMCLQLAKNDPKLVNFDEFQYQGVSLHDRMPLLNLDVALLGKSLVGNTHLRFLTVDMNNMRPFHHQGAATRTEQAFCKGLTNSLVGTLVLAGASRPFQRILFDDKTKLNLQSLDLFGTVVDTLALGKLLRPVSTKTRHQQLMRLSLGYCNLNDDDMQAISLALKDNRHLTALNFNHNLITNLGIRYFCESWKNECLFEELDLSWNKFGSQGARMLMQTIAKRTHIRFVVLNGNVNIGCEGVTWIGEQLAHVPLTRFELQNCVETPSLAKIKNSPEFDAMGRALADGLRRNTTLKILYIGTNGLGPLGAQLIMQAVAVHPTLGGLSFAGDASIGLAGLKRIGLELPHTRLVGLKLDGIVPEWPSPQTKLARTAGQALVNGVRNTSSLHGLSLTTMNAEWQVPVQFHLKLNHSCRPLLSSDAITQAVWANILAWYDRQNMTGFMFFCLREQPWLVSPSKL